MLSSFSVAWLVSNDWDCLMSLWKKNHALFLLYGSIYLVFSLMLYLGWLGTCLQHVWLLQIRHKPLWSFGFWLVMPFYASFNDVLSLCMIMAVIALLVGRSQSFASPHFVLSMSSLVHPTPKNQVIPMCSPYIPINNLLFQVYLTCFYLSFELNSFGVMWKLVIKALTNLMAHFTFLCF
jgi:hypothetical protein